MLQYNEKGDNPQQSHCIGKDNFITWPTIMIYICISIPKLKNKKIIERNPKRLAGFHKINIRFHVCYKGSISIS